MRRIVSAEEEAKKKKKRQVIIGVVLAFIMVASTIGFAIQSNSGIGNSPQGDVSGNEIEYNGFKFVNQNGLWVLGNFVFRYVPQQVPEINSEVKPASNYQGKPAYVYSEDDGAEIEIAVNLGQIAQRVQKACPGGTTCEGDLPIKTCSDNFIIIKVGNTSSIKQENNCVFIEGGKEELTALADQFLFKTLGIR